MGDKEAEASELRRKMEKASLLEKREKLREGLPHLYGWKWYRWAREFFESVNPVTLLCAANQISKSSTQIRKAIHWATDQSLWPKIWPKLHALKIKPQQFWYLYPTKEVATIEWEKKWKTEFMPRGEFKDHPVYGWREEIRNRNIFAVHFNSGVSIYFKTYAQDAQHLQTGTCAAVFCDEELPVEHYDELMFRLTATDGYFSMVFTATLNQEFWRETMEERGTKFERLVDAKKLQVSMFDCLYYEDGSPGPWSLEKIEGIIKRCKSQAEVLRRVYGRFVAESGLKYPGYVKTKNMIDPLPIPTDWKIYGAVDYGSGGTAHPSAVVFVAVRPDYRLGYVFKAWRGDGIFTTASDALMKFLEMRGNLRMTGMYYDWQCADMKIISTRMNEPFQPAEKSHDIGEDIVNVLFKNGFLYMFGGDDEISKLSSELSSLLVNTPKQKAKDDLTDALRYAVVKIPWDWSAINERPEEPLPDRVLTVDEARRQGDVESLAGQEELDAEIEAWNELYEC